MRKLMVLCAVLFASAANAADLPKAVKAPVAVAAPSPFYAYIHGGLGLTSAQSDIAIPGSVVGSLKLWPAGAMLGGGFGVLNSTGTFLFGAEVEADYNFAHSSIGCDMTGFCAGAMKNSWFGAGKLLGGVMLSSIAGAIPGSAQPANWPVPITVPASMFSNTMLLFEIGAGLRNIDLCANDLLTGNAMCGSQWTGGLLFGGQLRSQISQNWGTRFEVTWTDFRSSWTPVQAIPLFTNTIAAKDEFRALGGLTYNF